MAEESKESAKHAFIEKITFAILPLLFTCVVYLMSALSSLSHEVTVLNSKISLVVTSDNKQATNTGAELARERLRQELSIEIQKNRDDIQYNRQKIAIIEDMGTIPGDICNRNDGIEGSSISHWMYYESIVRDLIQQKRYDLNSYCIVKMNNIYSDKSHNA